MLRTAHATVFAIMHAKAELIVPCVFVLITEHALSHVGPDAYQSA